MRLVHDDGAVLVEVGVPQTLPQQDPVRHVLDDRGRVGAVLETYRVTNFLT